MNSSQIKESIQNCLIKGEVEDAFNILITNLNTNEWQRFYDNVLILKSKWEKTKQEQLNGIISRDEYEISVNKIVFAIQTISNEINKNLNLTASESSKKPNKNVLIFAGFFFCGILFICFYYRDFFTQILIDASSSEQQDTTSQIPPDPKVVDSNLKNKTKTFSNKISPAGQPLPDSLAKEAIKKNEISIDNKSISEVEAKGVCFVDYQITKDSSQAEYLAERCAFITATRNLIEKVNGIEIRSKSNTENYKLLGDKIVSEASGKIVFVEQMGDANISGTRVEVKVKVNLN